MLIGSRLNSFKVNIQKSQQESSQPQMSKTEKSVSDNYKFQRKENQSQFKHGVKVMSKLKEARLLLEVLDVNLQKIEAAKEKISDGVDKIVKK